MIRIVIKRDQEGNIVSFQSTGHANYGSKGTDIICAGVSAILQATLIGLEEVVELKPDVEIKDGYLSCRLPDGLSRDGLVLLETMVLSLQSISNDYPKYVRIEDR